MHEELLQAAGTTYREARREAMRWIRDAEWVGEPRPQVRLSPHATRGLGT